MFVELHLPRLSNVTVVFGLLFGTEGARIDARQPFDRLLSKKMMTANPEAQFQRRFV